MDLQLIGGFVGLLANIPLLYGIWKGIVKQSFATCGLWAVLDFIAAYAIYQQDGNFWLPFLFGIGAMTASLLLLLNKCFHWGRTEWFVSCLVMICIFIQFTSGEFYAMIASIVALSIASVPQVIDTWKRPSYTPTKIYAVFCIANIVSLLGAKSFALEQVLFASSSLVTLFIITLFSMRKLKIV